MDLPKEFFTLNSMITLTGATGATYVICNGLQRVFDFNPKWLALAIGIIISMIGVYKTSEGEVLDYFVGLVNGFLIFCTTAGANETISSPTPPATPPAATRVSKIKRTFTTSWFR